jgi:hypothetical protein
VAQNTKFVGSHGQGDGTPLPARPPRPMFAGTARP